MSSEEAGAKLSMQRMGFVMRKATKTAIKEVALKFGRARGLKESYDIFDGGGTGIRQACEWWPVNDCTMTVRGSKQVFSTGLGDKSDTFFSNRCPF